MPKNSPKWPVFFTKIMKPQVWPLKNWCCSQNLTIVQNMRYREQNKFKKTLLFQIYHSLIFFFLKNVPILQFLSIFFYDFWLYFASDAKIKVYKRNLWSRWFFGMKVHFILRVYVANILLKFWVKVFLKIIVW